MIFNLKKNFGQFLGLILKNILLHARNPRILLFGVVFPLMMPIFLAPNSLMMNVSTLLMQTIPKKATFSQISMEKPYNQIAWTSLSKDNTTVTFLQTMLTTKLKTRITDCQFKYFEFPDESDQGQFEKFLHQSENNNVQFGLKFRNIDISSRTFDVVIEYPKPSFEIWSIFQVASTMASLFSSSSFFLPKVTQTLFHAINDMVFEDKILPVVNAELYEIKDSATATFLLYGGMVILSSLTYMIPMFVNGVVEEKENEQKLQLIASGVSLFHYWFSRLIVDGLIVFVVFFAQYLIFRLLAFSPPFTQNSIFSWGLLYLVFGLHTLTFSYVFSSFFKKTSQSSRWTSLFVSLLMMAYMFLSYFFGFGGKLILNIILSLFPGFSLFYGVNLFARAVLMKRPVSSNDLIYAAFYTTGANPFAKDLLFVCGIAFLETIVFTIFLILSEISSEFPRIFNLHEQLSIILTYAFRFSQKILKISPPLKKNPENPAETPQKPEKTEIIEQKMDESPDLEAKNMFFVDDAFENEEQLIVNDDLSNKSDEKGKKMIPQEEKEVSSTAEPENEEGYNKNEEDEDVAQERRRVHKRNQTNEVDNSILKVINVSKYFYKQKSSLLFHISVIFFQFCKFFVNFALSKLYSSDSSQKQSLLTNSSSFSSINEEIDENFEKKHEKHEEDEEKSKISFLSQFGAGFEVTKAVQRVNFRIDSGEVFAMLGFNGAGKTTLMNIISGQFCPSSLNNGKVLISSSSHNSNTSSHWFCGLLNMFSDSNSRNLISVCPQNDRLWENLTCRDHIRIYCLVRGILNPFKIRAIEKEMIEAFQMQKDADKQTKICSGGTKRKISCLLAFIGKPKLVLLDEPTSGMDVQVRKKLWGMIKKFRTNRAIIYVTHSMEEVENVADRIAIMANGKIMCIGGPQHLKSKFGNSLRISISCNGQDNLENAIQSISDFAKQKWGFGFAEYEELNEEFEENKERKDKKIEKNSNSQKVVRVLSKTNKICNLEIPVSKNETISEQMASLFEELARIKRKFSIVDYQMQQSSLESVFLKIANLQGS